MVQGTLPLMSCALTMNTDFDDLTAFKHWWESGRFINTPVEHAVSQAGVIHGVVLYRQAPYQVQLFIMPPNSSIDDHIHPNVDSYEVFIGGDIVFRCNGESYKQNTLGNCIRVEPSSWHGGVFGEQGGCFLSIQKWLNGVPPTTVGHDWRDANGNQVGSAYLIKD